MNLNGSEYYYIRNGQNDIIGLFDSTGTQVVSYTYDTWGKLVSIDGTLKDTVGVKNPYRYRGYRYDTETGLYYLQSRYYNPEMGRFINADSIMGIQGLLLSHNIFAYCLNNPVMYEDPNGDILPLIIAAAATAPAWVPVVSGIAAAVLGGVAGGWALGTAIKQTKSKSINLPSFKKLKIDMSHILSGHSPNGSRNPKGKKDVFWGMTAAAIQKALQEAYNVSTKIKTQGDSVLIRGFSKTYKYTIEMWVNIKDMVIKTAYPVD